MQVPGGQEDGLVRLQVDAVHQQGGEYAGVAGIELPDLGGGPGKLPELAGVRHPTRRLHHVADDLALVSPQAQQSTEHQPEPLDRGHRLISQRGDQCRRRGDAEPMEQRVRRPGLAEAAQRLGLPQRAQHLRLGPTVAIEPIRCIARHPSRLLPGVTRLRLFSRRMGLQRERPVGGDDLEQEGQSWSEAGYRGGSDDPLRVAIDQIVQRFAAYGRGGERMGAEPQLGLRLSGRRHAEKLGDHRRRAPGVRLDHSSQSLHHGAAI